MDWYEKAANTVNSRVPKDQWYNLKTYGEEFVFAPYRDFSKAQPKGCPSKSVRFNYTDDPGTNKPLPNVTVTQKLCVRVVVTDGCSGKKIVKNFWQKIVIVKGKVVDIRPPGSAADMVTYCKYPSGE